jgi:hypothetical protein
MIRKHGHLALVLVLCTLGISVQYSSLARREFGNGKATATNTSQAHHPSVVATGLTRPLSVSSTLGDVEPWPNGDCPIISGPVEPIEQNGQVVGSTVAISWVPCSSVSPGVSPLTNDPGWICAGEPPFAFTIGSASSNCYWGEGGGAIPNLGGPLYYLTNSTGHRVYLHQNSDGSGWSDCFGHGDAYHIGTVDAYAGSLTLSTDSSECMPNGSSGICITQAPMAFTVGSISGAPPTCYQGTGLYSQPTQNIYFLVNGTGYQLDLYQNSNGTGWKDCFDNNGAYLVWGLRDENPGSLRITTTTGTC